MSFGRRSSAPPSRQLAGSAYAARITFRSASRRSSSERRILRALPASSPIRTASGPGLLQREALRHPLAPLAAQVDGLVREDDQRLGRPLAPTPVPAEGEVVERTADGRVEVREPGPEKRDAERVASRAGERVAVVAANAHRAARDGRRLRGEACFGTCPGIRRQRRPGRRRGRCERRGRPRRLPLPRRRSSRRAARVARAGPAAGRSARRRRPRRARRSRDRRPPARARRARPSGPALRGAHGRRTRSRLRGAGRAAARTGSTHGGRR